MNKGEQIPKRDSIRFNDELSWPGIVTTRKAANIGPGGNDAEEGVDAPAGRDVAFHIVSEATYALL
jgi:hypothetical protein